MDSAQLDFIFWVAICITVAVCAFGLLFMPGDPGKEKK